MDYEDVCLFIDKTVKINCEFNGVPRFWTGRIVKINSENNSLLLRDKFDLLQLVSLGSITSINEFRDFNGDFPANGKEMDE